MQWKNRNITSSFVEASAWQGTRKASGCLNRCDHGPIIVIGAMERKVGARGRTPVPKAPKPAWVLIYECLHKSLVGLAPAADLEATQSITWA